MRARPWLGPLAVIGCVQAVAVALRVTGVIRWPWLVVLVPAWIALAAMLGLGFILLSLGLLGRD